jgi:hypothetical protein
MSEEWYYASGGAQQGPVTIDDLKARHAAGQIQADALIWKEGMDNWKPWNQVAELASAPEIVTEGAPVSPAPTADPVGDQIYAPPATTPYAGTLGGAGGPTVNPPNYLWQSIACTLLCCLPFGIVGIVYAAKVDGLSATGKAAAALEASNKAKFWCGLSFGTSIVCTILYLILMVAVA